MRDAHQPAVTALLLVALVLATAPVASGCRGPAASLQTDALPGGDGATFTEADSVLTPGIIPQALAEVVSRARARVMDARSTAIETARRRHLGRALIDAHAVEDLADLGERLAVATRGGLLWVQQGVLVDRLTVLEGLNQNHIAAMFAQGGHSLWLAFARGGCQVRQNGRLMDCPAELADRRITDWAEHQGMLCAVTWEGELLTLAGIDEPGGVTVRPLPTGDRLPMARHLSSCGGGLWVGSLGSGLGVLWPDGRWERPSSDRVVEAFACDGETLYVGGPGGLFRYDGSQVRPVALPPGPRHVRALSAFSGGLAVGLSDGRLVWIAEGRNLVLDLPAAGTVVGPQGGTLWFGGEGGLWGVPLDETGPVGSGDLIEVSLPGPGSTDISALASHGELLALGMFRDGIALWQAGGWRRMTERDGLPADEVNALEFDARGTLWVATSRGLARVDPASGVSLVLTRPELPCDHVNDLAAVDLDEWDDQVIAVAASCGVGLVDPVQGRILRWEDRSSGLPHRIVYTVTVWEDRLVVGTNDGLAVRLGDSADRSWTAYRAGRTSLTDNFITAVATTPSGLLVVGTYSGGVYLGQGPETLERLDGPRYVNPNALLATPDGVWVGGLTDGAYFLTPDRVVHLNTGPLLVGEDVTGFTRWGETLLIATRSGVSRIERGALVDR